jgi:hypothetical protein
MDCLNEFEEGFNPVDILLFFLRGREIGEVNGHLEESI